MDSQNPYAAPRSQVVEQEQQGLQLADRGARLGAVLLDGLCVGLIYLPLYLLVIVKFVSPDGGFGIGKYFLTTAIGAVLCFGIFLALNYVLMNKSGQTIGKRLVGLRVVSDSGEQASFAAQLKRYAFMYLLRVIPGVGNLVLLVDDLCIFRDSRKCLHDDVAGTIVVKA